MSSVLRYVDQLVKETSPADDVPRLEMQEGGAVEIKEDVSKSFKKILNQRGKVSISD